MDRLEEFMEREGWKRWETMKHGVMYYSWRKEGFEIDERDIDDLWEGSPKIEKEKYGRKVTFEVWKVEKVGELVEGIDTLIRQQAIDELKRLEKKTSKST